MSNTASEIEQLRYLLHMILNNSKKTVKKITVEWQTFETMKQSHCSNSENKPKITIEYE